MASRGEPTSLRECVQSYVDIQRRFKRGNHDADWNINLLMRYSGIEKRLTEKDLTQRKRYSEKASRI